MIIHDQALMFSRVHVNGTPIGAHQAVSTNRSETVDVSAPSLPRLFAFFGAVLMDMGCDPAAVSVWRNLGCFFCWGKFSIKQNPRKKPWTRWSFFNFTSSPHLLFFREWTFLRGGFPSRRFFLGSQVLTVELWGFPSKWPKFMAYTKGGPGPITTYVRPGRYHPPTLGMQLLRVVSWNLCFSEVIGWTSRYLIIWEYDDWFLGKWKFTSNTWGPGCHIWRVRVPPVGGKKTFYQKKTLNVLWSQFSGIIKWPHF